MPKPMTPSERVLGMALANAVRPRWEPDHAAARIAEVASPLAIRHALARLRRTLHSRPSAAGLRAEEVLCLALELQDGAMPATAS